MKFTSCKYKSISSIDPIELKSFSVITGPNGIGKSHLLQSLQQSSGKIDGITNSHISYYNWSDLPIAFDQSKNEISHDDEAGHWWTRFSQLQQTFIGNTVSLLNDIGVTDCNHDNFSELRKLLYENKISNNSNPSVMSHMNC
jgi:AAA15 family ATPase/GTPase